MRSLSRPPPRALLVEVLCLECRTALVHVDEVPLWERDRIERAMVDSPELRCPAHPGATLLQRIEAHP